MQICLKTHAGQYGYFAEGSEYPDDNVGVQMNPDLFKPVEKPTRALKKTAAKKAAASSED